MSLEKNKTLTVSVAAYNVGKTLGAAIESILMSKYCDWIEILIINDGSTDNTSDISHVIQKSNANIVRVIDKKNGGYGSTVNCSIREARGKYFKLLDGDDRFDSNELDKFMEYLFSSTADMIISDFIELWGEKKKKRIGFQYPEKKQIPLSSIDCNIPMHAICYKTEILKEIKMKLLENCLYTDTEFSFFPIFHISSIEYIATPVYMYSLDVDGQSVSKASRVKHIEDMKRINDELYKYYSTMDVLNGSEKMIVRKIAAAHSFYIESLLLCPISSDIKNKIIVEDKLVEKLFKLYSNSFTNRKLSILRKSKYILYPVCAIYEKLFEK